MNEVKKLEYKMNHEIKIYLQYKKWLTFLILNSKT